MEPSRRPQWFAAGVIALAAFLWLLAGSPDSGVENTLCLTYLLLSVLALRLRSRLSGIPLGVSVQVLFVILAIANLDLPRVFIVVLLSTLVENLWCRDPDHRPLWLVECASATIAAAGAFLVFHLVTPPPGGLGQIGLNIGAYLAVSVLLYSIHFCLVIAFWALRETEQFSALWKSAYKWWFPYYLLSGAAAMLVDFISARFGWEAVLFTLPVVYLLYQAYHDSLARRHQDELEDDPAATESADLRAMEALALAIEAKDDKTYEHLRRVEIYATEIGKEFGLSRDELLALRAAALLHDIGKAAVPEYIISKPGRLAPDEFDKIKIHPVVGAEILDHIGFPYPAAPIVRAHHERWDGNGYPDGLHGEAIPIGARILAAVDCLDALTTDRQYRRAVPLEEAVEIVGKEAGLSYDPAVVDVLRRRYLKLERLVQQRATAPPKLARSKIVTRGHSPASGLEEAALAPSAGSMPFLSSIASAKREAHAIFQLSRDLGSSLSLDETLSILALHLKPLIPFDTLVFYSFRDDVLSPSFVLGDNPSAFWPLAIPVGEGLTGWVAANFRPIVNGNPNVEPGYVPSPIDRSALRSALAIPLEGLRGFVGVLTFYCHEQDAFSLDHLRILRAISHQVTLSIENSLQYSRAEDSASKDYLTGLPNARSLFQHLDRELARARRQRTSLGVLLCDLNGFKHLNDRYGHVAGNEALKLVAEGLRSACRQYDYAARVGGDEFVVVMPGLAAATIKKKCEELEDLPARVTDRKDLSMSVGSALFPEDYGDVQQLIAAADRRMYENKEKHKSNRSANQPHDSHAPAPVTLR